MILGYTQYKNSCIYLHYRSSSLCRTDSSRCLSLPSWYFLHIFFPYKIPTKELGHIIDSSRIYFCEKEGFRDCVSCTILLLQNKFIRLNLFSFWNSCRGHSALVVKMVSRTLNDIMTPFYSNTNLMVKCSSYVFLHTTPCDTYHNAEEVRRLKTSPDISLLYIISYKRSEVLSWLCWIFGKRGKKTAIMFVISLRCCSF